MKYALLVMLTIGLFSACQPTAKPINLKFVATDLDNFWQAYDQIQAAPDSMQQLN